MVTDGNHWAPDVVWTPADGQSFTHGRMLQSWEEMVVAWGAPWQEFDPGLSAASGLSLGTNGANYGRYRQIGSTVFVKASAQFGGTGVTAGTGTYYMRLPVTRSAATSVPLLGCGIAYDSGTFAYRTIWPYSSGTGLVIFYVSTVASPMTASVPWTWKAGDWISIDLTYEAA